MTALRSPARLPRLILSIVGLLLLSVGVESAHGENRLIFLGVTHNGAPPEGRDTSDFDWAQDNFARMFGTRSKELFSKFSVVALKGEEATKEAWLSRLSEMEKRTDETDLLFIYFGSHGGTTPESGWGAGVAGGEIRGRELREALGKLPCHCIVAISTCGSGGFGRPNRDEPPLPSNVTALCACRKKRSTGTQLDIATLEGLAGFADSDHDGEVTLRELVAYIPDRYREMMTDEQRQNELQEHLPVVVHSESAPLDRPLTKSDPHRAAVFDRGEWHGAIRLGRANGNVRCRFLGWNAFDEGDKSCYYADTLLGLDQIVEPGGFPPVSVSGDGQWRPAIIQERSRKGFRVRYPDTGEEGTVPQSRLRYALGSKASDLPAQ